jgi:predicted ATPase with chaperone activity
VHRLMRVARTIADLSGSIEMTQDHVLAAGGLRDPAIHPAAQLAA